MSMETMGAIPPATPEQLSYAMRNNAAREHFLGFNAPAQLVDWSHLAIEALMLVGALLALLHAFRHARQHGTTAALHALAGIFLYGLVMDISSYYTVNNFWHGEFTVMLVWNRLPLYIALLYPAFIYHCYMTIRRHELAPFDEAVAVAFYSGILYMVFDNLGPALNWWVWDRQHPASQPLLDNVPLTSYHWLFLFNGALAYCLRRGVWEPLVRGEARRARLGVALLPVLTIAVGSLLFLPYNLFIYAFEGMAAVSMLIHALAFFLAGYGFLLRWRRPMQAPDGLLLLFPLMWLAVHLYLTIAKHDRLWAVGTEGLNAAGLAAANPWAVGAGLALGLAITLGSHLGSARVR